MFTIASSLAVNEATSERQKHLYQDIIVSFLYKWRKLRRIVHLFNEFSIKSVTKGCTSGYHIKAIYTYIYIQSTKQCHKYNQFWHFGIQFLWKEGGKNLIYVSISLWTRVNLLLSSLFGYLEAQRCHDTFISSCHSLSFSCPVERRIGFGTSHTLLFSNQTKAPLLTALLCVCVCACNDVASICRGTPPQHVLCLQCACYLIFSFYLLTTLIHVKKISHTPQHVESTQATIFNRTADSTLL